MEALNSLAGLNFLGGSWWVPSSTNLWGIDTGDPTKVAFLTNLFAPFTAFNQGEGGLQYQLAGFLAAQLPVSDSCDAETCFPMTPPEVVTGSTSFDRLIGYLEALSGQGNGENFGLFQNWFQVPIQNLINGYTFEDAYNPSGPASNDPAFGFGDGTNPFLGGTIGEDDAMPWNGQTYVLNLLQPFQNYWEHLLEDPATEGDLPGTGIQIPTLGEFGQSLQSVTASLIAAFNPLSAGSPACPGQCDIPEGWSTPELVDMLDPDDSNPMIQAWLAGFAEDALYPNNNATQEQINYSIALLQTGMYNLTPEQVGNYNDALASINGGAARAVHQCRHRHRSRIPAVHPAGQRRTGPRGAPRRYVRRLQPHVGLQRPARAGRLRDQLGTAAQHRHAGNIVLPAVVDDGGAGCCCGGRSGGWSRSRRAVHGPE